jgi:hypothetical protein
VAEAATLAAWTGRELLFFGPLASVAYSPADDSWRPVASMPVERGVVESAWSWTGERLLVWGFQADSNPEWWRSPPQDHVPVALAYDAASDRWTTLPDTVIPGGVPWYGELQWTGHEVLALAVTPPYARYRGADDQFNRPFAYDPATATWRTIAPLPFQLTEGAVGAWLDGRWYWITGDRQSMFAYDLQADAWTPLPTPPLPLTGDYTTLGPADHRLFAAGGPAAALLIPSPGSGSSPPTRPC